MKSIREECGVVGVLGHPDAASMVYLGLFAQQHRGQEGCGIVSLERDGQTEQAKFNAHKSFGLVAESFNPAILSQLKGDCAVGHVRYSTQGGHIIQNVQPFYFRTSLGALAIAHNGNLTNAAAIRTELERSGSVFQSTSDSEIFVHLLARAEAPTILERIFTVMAKVSGAYSMVIQAESRLYAVRDPYGFRPLVLGQRQNSYIVASETCALDLMDATLIREIQPGEVVEITAEGLTSHFPLPKRQTAFCSFEPIYFARPDSQIFGDEIYSLRRKMGRMLAEEAPAPDADIVIAVPDSGVPMAVGFSEGASLPFELGLVRNHYVGRTFIQPAQEIRDFGVRLKLNPVLSVLKGKSVVVVDDSIVRGTTSAKIIRMIRQAGAKRIHMRIGSPPITYSCFYGVDTPERAKLLAAQKNVDAIRAYIGCDSLAYLSIEGLRSVLGDSDPGRFCTACFNGKYPESVHASISTQPTDACGPGLRSGI
ncbi:MAG: amidophosphoribosyltransferase [Deltaproteobacteria bacterium]|nr:amidophosphoribosyltransferase [Deltaproteobacteria bacterium]